MNDFIIEKKNNYVKITCKEGHYITEWNKDDIKDFSSAKMIFCPTFKDISTYYCITEEENEEYLKLQMEEYERIEKEKEKNKNL